LPTPTGSRSSRPPAATWPWSPAPPARKPAAGQMATAAKSAHADGIYINATSNALGKTKSFLHAMQIAGY